MPRKKRPSSEAKYSEKGRMTVQEAGKKGGEFMHQVAKHAKAEHPNESSTRQAPNRGEKHP